jgi:hypothetical protein
VTQFLIVLISNFNLLIKEVHIDELNFSINLVLSIVNESLKRLRQPFREVYIFAATRGNKKLIVAIKISLFN